MYKLTAGVYLTQDMLAKESEQVTDLHAKSKGQATESSTMTVTLVNIQTLKSISTSTITISIFVVKTYQPCASIQT